MSKVESSSDLSSLAMMSGSIRWLPPEHLNEGSRATFHSDAYSFSMTVLECLTLCDPFADIKRDIQVLGLVMKGSIPSRPDFDSIDPWLNEQDWDGVWELMVPCWASLPSQRPSMLYVSQMLAGFVRDLDLLSPEQLIQRVVTQVSDGEDNSKGAEYILMSYRGDKAEKALEFLRQVPTCLYHSILSSMSLTWV